MAGTGRESARTLTAREINDPDHNAARHHGSHRQATQQPVPVITQRDKECDDGRGREQRLHHPTQHPARQGGRRDGAHGNSACTRICGMSDGGNRKRYGEDKPSDDQPDHVAWMPVASRRQKAVAPVLRGRRRRCDMGFGRLCHGFSADQLPG